MVRTYEVERDVKMAAGDTTEVSGYVFTFRGWRDVQGPNYDAVQALVEVTRDGEPVEGGAWIVRVYVKPFVNWIWGGCALMALGGALAISDRRYRAKKEQDATTTAGAAA
jgi:cytochrome c-type biogenesis protein CcmF